MVAPLFILNVKDKKERKPFLFIVTWYFLCCLFFVFRRFYSGFINVECVKAVVAEECFKFSVGGMHCDSTIGDFAIDGVIIRLGEFSTQVCLFETRGIHR